MASSQFNPGDDGCWKEIGVWRLAGEPCEKLEHYTHCHHCPVFSQMAKKVLGRPALENLRSDTPEVMESKAVEGNTISAFVVKLGDVHIAFPSAIMNQVMVFSRIHSIPNRQTPILKGMVNIDGELKICISLGQLLNIEPGNKSKNTYAQRAVHERLISIETSCGEWILPVSAVVGHQSLVACNNKEASQRQQSRYISSVLMFEDNPVLFIDTEALDKGLLDAVGGLYG